MFETIKKYLIAKLVRDLTADEEAEAKKQFDTANPAPQPPNPAAPTPPIPGANNDLNLLREVSELKNVVTSLSKTLADQEAKISEQNKSVVEKAKKERDAEIAKILDEAKKGKIPADNPDIIASWKLQLETNFDSAKKILDSMPVNPAFKAQEKGKENNQQQNNNDPEKPQSRGVLMTAAKEAFAENMN
jgi:hypothetical protein